MRSITLLAGTLAATLVGASPRGASAQIGLPAGSRVRLELADGSTRAGWVGAADSATIRLAGDRDQDVRRWRAIPLADVRRYQIARGHRRFRGTLIGAGVGGALGLGLVGYGLYGDAHSSDPMIPSMIFTLPLATIATALGAGCGALAAPTRWSAPVRVARTAAPALRPYLHDHSLGVAFAFRC